MTEAEAAAAEAAPAEEEPVAEAETATEAEPAAGPETPGFDSVFALTGLLAVAYLVLDRRE